MSLLEKLHERRQHFTAREKAIAAYLESGYPHAGLDSATTIAERTGASTATVVRFIAKLGYEGYNDFQRHLREAVEVRLTSPLQRLDERLDTTVAASSDGEIVQRTFEVAISSITQTFSTLDQQRLTSIAKLLVKPKGRVIVVGTKRAITLAVYLYSSLNLFTENVVLLSLDQGFASDQLMDLNQDDIVVVFDLRRYSHYTAKIAHWAHRLGATLVVLGDAPKTPLSGLTIYRVNVEASNVGVFDTYVGGLLTIDALVNLVGSMAPAQVRERLKLGEKSWQEFNIFWSASSNDAPAPRVRKSRLSKKK